jgi:hypothetical protein
MAGERPNPLVPDDCDVSDIPFPHELLVALMSDAFGLSEQCAVDTAISNGFVRVGNGWMKGPVGNG